MVGNTNIPIGYKDSVVGIIPQEWEVMALGKLVSITSGNSPSLYNLHSVGKYPYIKVEDMNNCEKYQMLSRDYTDDERNLVPKGSIIFPKRGAAIINNKVRIAVCDLCMDSNMMAIVPNKLVNGEFLYFKIIHEQLFKIADTSTIPQINNKHIIPYILCLPPLAEQKKIAEILCSWDDAIEKQSKLIEKLELRKRGLMQRLLTGKTRLPGFTEPWINIRIGELCLMKRGEILVSDDYIFGDIPVVAGGKEPAGFHNVSNRNGNIITISSSGASAGFVAFYEKPIFATDCFTISSSEKYNVRFFYYYLMMSQERIYRLQSGGAQPHVHPKDLAPMMLRIPSLEEQNAVVKIILSSDKEIEIQRKKLEALRQQKQGLMQQLLTGKTRVKI